MSGEDRRTAEGALLRSGLQSVEDMVRPTVATKVEVLITAKTTGDVVGEATWLRESGWKVSLMAQWGLKTHAGQVTVKLTRAR